MEALKVRRIFFAAALGSLLLAGPAIAEEASSEAIAASIPIGATQQEVESHYGTPTHRTLSEDGNAIWTYDIKHLRVEHQETLLSTLGFSSGNEAVDETERMFRIWFDKDGKVADVKALQ